MATRVRFEVQSKEFGRSGKAWGSIRACLTEAEARESLADNREVYPQMTFRLIKIETKSEVIEG